MFQGFQTQFDKLEGSDSCSVLVFVDDSMLLGESEKHLQELIDAYRNFTTKWRIRVNAGKCAIIQHRSIAYAQWGTTTTVSLNGNWMKHNYKYLGAT